MLKATLKKQTHKCGWLASVCTKKVFDKDPSYDRYLCKEHYDMIFIISKFAKKSKLAPYND